MYVSSSPPENVAELVSTQIGFPLPYRGPGTCARVQYCRVVPSRANNTVALEAVAADLETADADPFFTVRNVRLTADQAAELSAVLSRMVDELTDAGPTESRYGVAVSVYRPRQPHPRAGS